MTDVPIRPIGRDDTEALRAFFQRVPEGDRTFFREDVLAEGAIANWLVQGTDQRDVAVDGDDIVGYVGIVPLVGWSSHVAELRVIVDPSRRRQGIGRALARHGLLAGIRHGFTKLVVEVVADQEPTVALFTHLGFQPEALLRDHVRDDKGDTHDLIVMAHFADETFSAMQVLGIEEILE